MTHPIIPPPELVQQWIREKDGLDLVVARAAQWGADQELEACCEWFESEPDPGHVDLLRSCATALRAARRPKPLSLKERALQAWTAVEAGTDDQTAMAVIRRALEALPND